MIKQTIFILVLIAFSFNMKSQSDPIHIKSSQNNLLHLNSTDSDYSWIGWSRNENYKITMGINNLDDFYIDRRYNDNWHSNTFVIKRNSGKIGIGTSVRLATCI